MKKEKERENNNIKREMPFVPKRQAKKLAETTPI